MFHLHLSPVKIHIYQSVQFEIPVISAFQKNIYKQFKEGERVEGRMLLTSEFFPRGKA